MTGKRLCKGLRNCPVLGRIVSCSGLCCVVYGHVDSHVSSDDVAIICPVRERALDEVLNGD